MKGLLIHEEMPVGHLRDGVHALIVLISGNDRGLLRDSFGGYNPSRRLALSIPAQSFADYRVHGLSFTHCAGFT